VIKRLETLKNTVNKYMADIRSHRLTICQSERKSVLSRRPSVHEFDRKWLKYHHESTVDLIIKFQWNTVPRYMIVGVYLLPDSVTMGEMFVHKGNKQYAEWNLIMLLRLFTLVSYLESWSWNTRRPQLCLLFALSVKLDLLLQGKKRGEAVWEQSAEYF
jgi:hypothetical protein